MEIKAREQWRVERIRKAVKIACKILSLDEAQIRVLIHDIDDIHGRLCVFWNHPMTDAQCHAFRVAWELCGEKPENTEHRVFW